MTESDSLALDLKLPKADLYQPDLRKLYLIGSGSYGKVYRIADSYNNHYALKRNQSDNDYDSSEVIREANILASLKGHPNIVPFLSVVYGNPFSSKNGDPLSPINFDPRGNSKICRDDPIHFIFELGNGDLESFLGERFRKNHVNFEEIRHIIADILLGVEFINKSHVMHRDLKPENIVIFPPENRYGSHRAKIADFGLSKFIITGEINTPGVTTSWYRAPELFNKSNNYSSKIDDWSTGCILYRIFVGRSLFSGSGERSEQLQETLIRNSIYKLSDEEIAFVGYVGNVRQPIVITEIKERIQRNRAMARAIRQDGDDTFNQIESILLGMLQVNPEKRLTSSDVLDSPFFDSCRDYINDVREEHPNKYIDLYFHRTPNIKEREWADVYFRHFYENRHGYPWYSDVRFFHTISLFDRILRYYLRAADKNSDIFNKTETILYLFSCLYISIKFFSVLDHKYDIMDLLPEKYIGIENVRKSLASIEISIFSMLEFRIHRVTVYDFLCKYPNKREYLDRAMDLLTTPPYPANNLNPCELATKIVSNEI